MAQWHLNYWWQKTGTYTNAIYGFLSILFKITEDIKPEYMVITFDLKAPTHRHKLYDGYKANRKGMPNELASQMPIVKDILRIGAILHKCSSSIENEI